MPAVRLMPTDESADLIELTREIVDKELRPRADEAERAHAFPRDVFRHPGAGSGLLSLPYPETYGGGGQPHEVYLQVLEEIATAWAAVGVGTSVHALSCFGLFHRGHARSRSSAGCRTCSAASSWAPTACPRRTPAPTPRRCGPGPSATATTT